MISAYHTKYFAYELTRRCPLDSVEKLVSALVDAQVDLNPHQVDAALFAFNSPLSKGALLADEVGLGKTIEAGLVLSQKWAERKRRILVITPSNLRQQWFQELTEKFFLPCRILEAKPYNAAIRLGQFRPFEVPEIVICSYQFAKSKSGDVQALPWDLVVIDEAHRQRNVYKPSNVIANTLKLALAGKHKLLLTAMPLQNSLLKLFGLVSFIDEHTFGDLKSFREQFAKAYIKSSYKRLITDHRVYFGKDGSSKPTIKRFLSEIEDGGVIAMTTWHYSEVGENRIAAQEVKSFKPEDPFGTPKPQKLLQRILDHATNPGDLVLDSLAGTGTTGAVAHKMAPRWIMIELGGISTKS